MTRLATIVAILLAMTALATVPAASASVATAEGIAQNYQNSECGFAATWKCQNSRYLPQACFDGGSGIGYYQCSGAVREYNFVTFGWRTCTIYVNVQKGTGAIIYHYNTCRH